MLGDEIGVGGSVAPCELYTQFVVGAAVSFSGFAVMLTSNTEAFYPAQNSALVH